MVRVISDVAFGAEEVTITYLSLPEDLRQTGLALQHQLVVPLSEDYHDEIEELMNAAIALLEDALEDFPKVPEYEPPEPDEENDDDDD